MNLKEKLELYEAALQELADWGLAEEDMSCTDDNGASAKWARALLSKAGAAPIHGQTEKAAHETQ